MHINLAGKAVCELDFSAHDPNTADPKEVVALRAITSIDASNNKISSVKRLGIFVALRSLNLSQNQITSVESLVAELGGGVEQIDVSHNRIESLDGEYVCRYGWRHSDQHPSQYQLPGGFAALRALVWLNLSFNEIATPATEGVPIFPESLEYLDISFNQITSVSSIVIGLSNLTELHCEGNEVKDLEEGGIPAIASNCPMLEQLFFDANPIVSHLGAHYLVTVSSLLLPHCPRLRRLNGEDCCPSPSRNIHRSPARQPASQHFDVTREIVAQLDQRDSTVAEPPQFESNAPADALPVPPRLQRHFVAQHAMRGHQTQSSSEVLQLERSPYGVPAAKTVIVPDSEMFRDEPVNIALDSKHRIAGLHSGRYTERIEYLRKHADELQRLLCETQDSAQSLLCENAQLERDLREQRRHVGRQLKESAALKAERESLRSAIATLRLGMTKKAAELQHARRVEQRTLESASQQRRSHSASQPKHRASSRPLWQTEPPEPPRMTRSHMKLVESTNRKLAAQRTMDMGISSTPFKYNSSPIAYGMSSGDAAPTPSEGHSFEMGTFFELRPEAVGSDGSLMTHGSKASPQSRRKVRSETGAYRLPDPGPYLREPKWYELQSPSLKEPHLTDSSTSELRLASRANDSLSLSMPELR